MLVAIDLSLRSAGIVALDDAGTIQNRIVVAIDKEDADDEYLLLAIESRICDFISQVGEVDKVVLEELAYNGKSARRDLIDGNWWNLKKEIRQSYGAQLRIDSVPVTEWRASVLTLDERRDAKKTYGKDGLKIACVNKLPPKVRENIEEYIRAHALPKKAWYDLTDAYWLGRYAQGHREVPIESKTRKSKRKAKVRAA